MLPSDLDARRTLPRLAIDRVQLLAGAIRDRDPEAIEEHLLALDQQALIELAFTAAAMLPMDQTPRELLDWNESQFEHARATLPPAHRPMTAARCGTSAGYERHRNNGQLPCADCRRARREADHCYYLSRKARRLALVAGG